MKILLKLLLNTCISLLVYYVILLSFSMLEHTNLIGFGTSYFYNLIGLTIACIVNSFLNVKSIRSRGAIVSLLTTIILIFLIAAISCLMTGITISLHITPYLVVPLLTSILIGVIVSNAINN